MRKTLSPSELGFGKRDLNKLSKALTKVSDLRVYRRIQAVMLVAKGRKYSEVSQITGLSLSTVYNTINRYLTAHQIESLKDLQHPGRPKIGNGITKTRILRALQQQPFKYGFQTNVWTVKILAKHLSLRYLCPISPRTLRRRMKQIGLVCKRPRYYYSEKDPHRTQKKGALLDA